CIMFLVVWLLCISVFFFFSSRRRHTRSKRDWSSDVCSSDLQVLRTQFALDDSQYFSNLEVLPAEPDRTTRIVLVNIHADPSRRHHYSFGPGYATDTGARGT